MADEDIVLRYRADVSKLRDDIGEVISLNEELAQSVEDASKAYKDYAKAQKEVTKQSSSGSSTKTIQNETKATEKQIGTLKKLEDQLKKLRNGQKNAFGEENIKAYQKRIDATTAKIRSLTTVTEESSQKQAVANKQQIGTLQQLETKLTRLREAQRRAFGSEEVQRYQKSIDATKAKIQSLTTTQETSNKRQLGTLGQLRAELKRLERAQEEAFGDEEVKRYQRSIDETRKKIRSLTSDEKKLASEQKKLNKQTGVFSNTVKRIGAGIAIAFSVQQIKAFVKEAVKVTAEFDSISRSFAFIEGSNQAGVETFQFLTRLAEEYGLELRSTVEAYRQFSGAARLAGLTSFETQEIFTNTTKAITALGLGAQEADRIFLALSQIVSKGVVSAEELRRQLGDALPGAFSIAAQSVGKTEAEFNKLLSTGQILSKDFLPNFSRLLGETFEEGAVEGAKSLNAELNRLQNITTELQVSLGERFAPVLLRIEKTALEAVEGILNLFSATGRSFNVFKNVAENAGNNGRVLAEALTQIGVSAEGSAKQIQFLVNDLAGAIPNIIQENKQIAAQAKTTEELNNRIEELRSTQEFYRSAAEAGLITTTNAIQLNQFLNKEITKLGDAILDLGNKTEESPLTNEKAQRELLDFNDLIQKDIEELNQIREEEARVAETTGDKIAKKNEETTVRVLKAIEKQQAALRKFFEDANALGDIPIDIVLDFKIKQAGGPTQESFTKIASELFREYQEELERIETLAQSQLLTALEGKDPDSPEGKAIVDEEDEKKQLKLNVAAENYSDIISLLIKKFEELGFKSQFIFGETNKGFEEWIKNNEEILRSVGDLYSQLAALAGAFTDRRIQELDRELKAVRDAANEEEENLRQQRENRLITEEFFQNELARIKEKEKETEEKVNKEKNKLARKQAILDKSAAIYDITLNTAVAISENLGKPFLIALIAALGAAQIATVVATPIPQFARGTKGKKDSGMAIVGEEGPEMTFLDRGTKVLPAKQTKQYSNVFDAMYDNRFDDYVLKEYVSPALEAQKKQYESQRQETFAQNIVNSMTGLTYYDLEASRKKGQYINNIDEFAKAVAKASEINYRRL